MTSTVMIPVRRFGKASNAEGDGVNDDDATLLYIAAMLHTMVHD